MTGGCWTLAGASTAPWALGTKEHGCSCFASLEPVPTMPGWHVVPLFVDEGIPETVLYFSRCMVTKPSSRQRAPPTLPAPSTGL